VAECSDEERKPETNGIARVTEEDRGMQNRDKAATATESTRRREGRRRARASRAPADSASTRRPGEGRTRRATSRRRRESARKRAGRRRAGSPGNGWWGWWALREAAARWRRRSAAAASSARSGGSASTWPREGSARAAGARRKSACSTSSRRSAAAYGDEGEADAAEGRPRALDGGGSGVEGKRKDGCGGSRGGTDSRRCGAWRPDMTGGGGSGAEVGGRGPDEARSGLWTMDYGLVVTPVASRRRWLVWKGWAVIS